MERKIVIYYESNDSIDEDALIQYVHRFFCENPDDQNVEDCPLYAMTLQDVLVEEE
jgi:hypothetical protein